MNITSKAPFAFLLFLALSGCQTTQRHKTTSEHQVAGITFRIPKNWEQYKTIEYDFCTTVKSRGNKHTLVFMWIYPVGTDITKEYALQGHLNQMKDTFEKGGHRYNFTEISGKDLFDANAATTVLDLQAGDSRSRTTLATIDTDVKNKRIITFIHMDSADEEIAMNQIPLILKSIKSAE